MHSIVNGKRNLTYDLGVPKGICTHPDVGGEYLSKSHGVCLENHCLTSLENPRRFIASLPSDFSAECMTVYPDTSLTPAFTGIGRSGGECAFYCCEEKITTLRDVEHSLVQMNGKIYIFPEKLCYSEEEGLTEMEKNVTDTFSFAKDGTITLEGFDFPSFFKKGDSIKITGGENETYEKESPDDVAEHGKIVSVTVLSSEEGVLKTAVYGDTGEALSFVEAEEECTLSLLIPDLTSVAVYRNRLWGTGRGTPGKFIYASAPGNPTSFGTFRGTSADSWWGAVSSPGSFSASAPFGTNCVFFKKNTIHFLYGASPESFSLPYTAEVGCINEKTVAEASGRLFFQGASGIYQLSGTSAVCISEGVPQLKNAICAVSFGGNYYVSTDEGLFCYYPNRNTWLCIDEKKYDALTSSGVHFMGISGNEVSVFSKRGEEGFSEFLLESSRIILPESPESGVISAVFTMDIKEGFPEFFIDSGKGFSKCQAREKKGLCHIKVPVRLCHGDYFRYRIKGVGSFVLLGVEVTL